MTKSSAVGLFLLLSAITASGQVRRERGDVDELLAHPHRGDEVLVRFKGGMAEGQAAGLRNGLGARLLRRLALRSEGDLHVLQVPHGGRLRDLLTRLLQSPLVEYAEPNYRLAVVPAAVPNDPSFGSLWGMDKIQAPAAWDVTTGSPGVTVAVIDTGADWNHPDLAANIWTNPGEVAGDGIDNDGNGYVDDVHGYDFANGDGDPMDDHWHGTHVAGTIGAVGNNGAGVAGVNWTVRVMPLKFLNSAGSGSTADAISAINYAAANGAHVINNSWGGGAYSQALLDAIEASGLVNVCAAGNGDAQGNPINTDLSPHYPSSYVSDKILSVAATDSGDLKASWSNYGALSVDLAAPGVSIISTMWNDVYGTASGTSMATPHVAGVAALIKAAHPSATWEEIRARIFYGTDHKDSLAGLVGTCGRLNAARSIEADAFAPAGVTDLAAGPGAPSYEAVLLSFTAVGEDLGTGGACSAYDVRYSTSPIDGAAFDAASKAAWCPAPGAPGAVEFVTVEGLAPSTTYHLAVKAIDNVGNVGPISNGVTRATAAGPVAVAADDFESAGFAGGIGWNAPWALAGTAAQIYTGNPVSGAYYARVRGAGSITRGTNLAGVSQVKLRFWTRLSSLEGSDGAFVEASPDGIAWTTVFAFDPLYGDNVWHSYEADLGLPVTADFRVRFRGAMNSTASDFWYLDDVQFLASSAPPADEAPVITSTPVTSATVGFSYGYDVEATGMPAPGFSLLAAPAGMTINAVSGLVSWTPSPGQAGLQSVTVRASNGVSPDATQSFTVDVSEAPSIVSTPVTSGAVGAPYSYDVEAAGTPAAAYALLLAPAGMTIDSVSGLLSWTPSPAQAGANGVTVTATNAAGSDSQGFTVAVSGPPSITSTPLTTATVGAAYAYDVNAGGYPAPSYSLGAGPAGMTINSVSGLIAWTPGAFQVGSHGVTAIATNASGSDSQVFTVGVAPAGAATLAFDDFESGTWSGGTGWSAAWTKSGDVAMRSGVDAPYSGIRHVRLRRGTGYLSRPANLSGQGTVHLKVWAKVRSFEGSDKAYLMVSSNGGASFTTLRTFTPAESDDVYHEYVFDVSAYATSGFVVAVDAAMNSTGDYLFIDDVALRTGP